MSVSELPHHADESTAILIAEDEPRQRMSLADVVEGIGYAIIEATDADHAITALEAQADIHIVIADIHMPGSMDGLQLAATIRERWPPVGVIVISGSEPPEPDALPARTVFLRKPVTQRQVRVAVERLATSSGKPENEDIMHVSVHQSLRHDRTVSRSGFWRF